MSTLADLQRRNLEQMKAADAPQPDPAPSEIASTSDLASNEVSIIPSYNHSINASNAPSSDDVKEQMNDGGIEGRIEGVKAPSEPPSIQPSSSVSQKKEAGQRKAAGKANAEPEKPEAEKPETEKASLKDALETHLRTHLLEQLMPAGGKGPVTRLNVEMPEGLHQRLKQQCVKSRTPIKALINALIALYLEEEE